MDNSWKFMEIRVKKETRIGKKSYLCTVNSIKRKKMEARTINVSVRIPKSYRVDLLQQQLTAYAQQLIDAAKPAKKAKRQYRHEALCGIFSSGASEEELIEEYLKNKYEL